MGERGHDAQFLQVISGVEVLLSSHGSTCCAERTAQVRLPHHEPFALFVSSPFDILADIILAYVGVMYEQATLTVYFWTRLYVPVPPLSTVFGLRSLSPSGHVPQVLLPGCYTPCLLDFTCLIVPSFVSLLRSFQAPPLGIFLDIHARTPRPSSVTSFTLHSIYTQDTFMLRNSLTIHL